MSTQLDTMCLTFELKKYVFNKSITENDILYEKNEILTVVNIKTVLMLLVFCIF